MIYLLPLILMLPRVLSLLLMGHVPPNKEKLVLFLIVLTDIDTWNDVYAKWQKDQH